jgi:excisionase family DNA binding protein
MMDSDEVEESAPVALADYRPPRGRDLTTAEVAALLDVSVDAVRRLVASGHLSATKAGRQLWVRPPRRQRLHDQAAARPRQSSRRS